MNKILLSIIGLLLVFGLFGQSYRTFDGSGNNVQNSNFGSVNSEFGRLANAEFNDGIGEPAGVNRPNPRVLSINSFWENLNSEEQKLKLSSFVWVWAKFIDHDINAFRINIDEPLPIEISLEDPYLAELAAAGIDIEMYRLASIEGTGENSGNPRKYANYTSSWIDGSMVYGNDQLRADWLRTFFKGKMKTSEGDLLPFNTISGLFNDPVDVSAPHMLNLRENNNKYFVTGDNKANETVQLLSLHTLFIREHNRLCDSLALAHPYWSDESLYLHARAIVGGIIQKITFEDWLPALGVFLDTYKGYDNTVNPSVTEFYALAGGNIGHSMLKMSIQRLNEYGSAEKSGNLTYQQGFYNPLELALGGGIDKIFRGMAVQKQSSINCYVPLEIRNFLLPDQKPTRYIDYWATAVNRGRETGLANYNKARVALGLEPIERFSDITSNTGLFSLLAESYADINDIDLWVGLLSEDHLENSAFGKTLNTLYKMQFQNLRDGDRYYYEIDPNLYPSDIALITNSALSDLILRNTDLLTVQSNVFYFSPMEEWPLNQYSISRATFDAVVFPVPSYSHINLVINATRNDQRAAVDLIDSNGSVIQQFTLEVSEGKNLFNLDSLNWNSPGVYFLRINNDTTAKVLKLIKSH